MGVLKHKQLKIKFGRSITDSEVTVVDYESYTVLLTIIGKEHVIVAVRLFKQSETSIAFDFQIISVIMLFDGYKSPTVGVPLYLFRY